MCDIDQECGTRMPLPFPGDITRCSDKLFGRVTGMGVKIQELHLHFYYLLNGVVISCCVLN